MYSLRPFPRFARTRKRRLLCPTTRYSSIQAENAGNGCAASSMQRPCSRRWCWRDSSSTCCAISRCPSCCCPRAKHNYKALPDRAAAAAGQGAAARAAQDRRASPRRFRFNTGEGLRAAYYVPYDEASYSSFKQHVHQIDMLFPEWLHVDASTRRRCWHRQRQPSRVSGRRRQRRFTIPTTWAASSGPSSRPRKTRKFSRTSTTTTPRIRTGMRT